MRARGFRPCAFSAVSLTMSMAADASEICDDTAHERSQVELYVDGQTIRSKLRSSTGASVSGGLRVDARQPVNG